MATPTATESTLPWKRDDDDDDEGGIQQNEFPSWVTNKDYLAYHSPSATFLGKLFNITTSFIKKKSLGANYLHNFVLKTILSAFVCILLIKIFQ